MHVAIVLAVPAFVALFWWQVQRVREGNTLSWAYVFEWPFFTAYAIYMWWRLVHDQTEAALDGAGAATVDGETPGTARSGSGDALAATLAATPADTAQDEELAAYNRYLAELHASGRRKRW